MRSFIRTLSGRVLAGALLTGAALTAVPAAANAAPATRAVSTYSPAVIARAHTAAVLASHEIGKPYIFGAVGPNAFDCSGLVQYVYAKLGVRVPRTADAQAHFARRVTSPVPGDLVFFPDARGYVFHVGIFAGYGAMYAAPHTGSVVKLQQIWTRNVFFGRVA